MPELAGECSFSQGCFRRSKLTTSQRSNAQRTIARGASLSPLRAVIGDLSLVMLIVLYVGRAVEGKIISSIVTREDTIVYANTTHEDFAKHVRGQRVVKVGRLGKYFYVSLPASTERFC